MKRKLIFFPLIFIIFPCYMSAQKVGVVLSGGGSRGMAHIGVLRALEDNQIPIDYIAGTSMGALIGGLYACGYTLDEITQLIDNEDFRNWSQTKLNSNKYYYFFKQHPVNPSWVNFNFRYDSSSQSLPLLWPTNIMSTFFLDFTFMKMFSGPDIKAKKSFDSLFVPFRCIAADIKDNKQVIFRKGSIRDAIRASITFPFVIKPEEIDNMLLFDGGMYNNFPSNVLYNEFFPDIIIGSKVAGNYEAPDADDLLSQIRSMLMGNTNYSVICDNGVMIEPNVEKVALLDFSKSQEFIDSGYAAASRKINKIRLFVTDSVSKEEREKKREAFRRQIPPLVINKIYTKGLNSKQAEYVDKILLKKAETITPENLKNDLIKLLADNKISSIIPKAVYNSKTGYYDLYLDVEKGEDFVLQFGGNISSSAINGGFIELQYNYLAKKSLSFATDFNVGRFYNAAGIRGRIDYQGKIPFFLQLELSLNQWDYFKTTTYFFEDKKPSYLIQNDNRSTLMLCFPAGIAGKIETGFSLARLKDEYYQTNTFTRLDTADFTYFDLYVPEVAFEINSLNRKQYADRGVYFKLCGKYLAGDQRYEPGSTSLNSQNKIVDTENSWFQVILKYDNYFDHLGQIKFGFYGELLYSNEGLSNNYISTLLSSPSFHPIPESQTLFLPSFRAHSYGGAGLKAILPLPVVNNLDLRLEGYVFQPYQPIFETTSRRAKYGEIFSTRSYIGSAVIVFHSPLGPVSLSLNYYSSEDNPFSLLFNMGYLIFKTRTIE